MTIVEYLCAFSVTICVHRADCIAMFTLLFIEDDEAIRTALRLVLEDEGYEVAEAGDGETGIKMFGQLDPDLVLLDLRLPDISGFEVCRAIRRTSITPVIMVTAQTDTSDLMSLIGDNEQTDYATATFKTTRLMNGHSIENQAAGVLDFRINHRFGNLNGGTYEWFGLDQANVKIGFDYGVLPWLMVGVGHTNVDKTYDGFVKAKILRQSTGKKKMPISLTYVASSAVTTLKWNNSRNNYVSSRYSYTHQLLIARKFSNATSLQIMPTLVHRNLIDLLKYKNDVYAIGVGGRQKLTQRMSINAEYYYVLPNQINPMYDNSFSLGFDIETGGHVFQLAFTNSRGMTDPQFITQTQGKWLKGDVRFGFNVSRVFTVRERK